MAKKNKQLSATSTVSYGIKDSPLGKIPEEWEVIDLGNKEYFSLKTGGTPSTENRFYWDDGNIPWLSSGEVHKKVIYYTDSFITKAGYRNSNARYIPIKSTLVALAGQGKTRGTAAITEIELTTNQSVAAIIPHTNRVEPYFLYFYIDSQYNDLRISSAGAGRAGLSLSILSKHRIKLPPLPEQSAIASILSTLYEAIEKTDRLIAKYTRIKQGLMQDLFHYGIDKNDQIRSEQTHRFKDSPLGRIPEEWDVNPLLVVIPKAQYGISTSLNDKAGIPVLRMNNLTHGKIDISDIRFSDDPDAYKIILKQGDILFNRTNSYEHVGRTSIWNDELENASFASYLVRLVPDLSKLAPHYLNYWLNLPEIQNAIRKYATPAVHQVNINPTNLRKTLIKLPPLPEQSRIATVLATTDVTIEKEQAYRHKLLALKRGLMEDLLTGKVRVPASLMEEFSQPEKPDLSTLSRKQLLDFIEQKTGGTLRGTVTKFENPFDSPIFESEFE